jgi:hypothetical protein
MSQQVRQVSGCIVDDGDAVFGCTDWILSE